MMGVVCGYCAPALATASQAAKEAPNVVDLEFLAHLFTQAEEASDVPRHLLAAIAAQESSFWPWSVNVSGRSFYAKSKQDALARIGNSQNYDLGLMQINSFWLSKFGVTAEDVLDPVINVLLGSTILMDCIGRYGERGGIACYHSGSPDRKRGKDYAEKVVAKWRALVEPNP